MADRSNFLIGYGERLASDMAAPAAGGPRSILTPLRRPVGVLRQN